MKFKDVRTIESLIKEYGMDSGPSTYGSNKSVMAPTSSPSTKKSPSPTTDKAVQSPATAGAAKKEQPKILAVRASDVPADAIVKNIKDEPMGKVVSRVGDKPKADALVVDTGKPGQKQYQVLDKNQKVFIDNPEYKEESSATKLISKLKIKSKKSRSIKKILRNGTTGIKNMKESIFNKFDKLSLEEQLRILEKVDTDKLNEAWSKKYKDSINCSDPKGFSQKAHCAGKKETNEEKVRLDPKCWKGKKIGNPKTKMKGGVRVNNCVPAESIEEKRRNPEQNRRAGSGKYDLINWAEDNITDRENWAVSMTNVPKLGVNPRPAVSEDTPKGIYFYPLQYFMKMADRDEELPWGDNMPYMQLFQYDRSGEMTRETKVDPAKLKQAILPYCSEEIIQQAIDEPEYDGTPFWFIYDCLTRLEAYDETTIIRWNKILRVLGFTSVYDPGYGWIAHGEPTQGVILDPRIIKQHKMFDNRNPTMQHNRYDIQGLASSIGWSSYYQREKQLQRVQINHPDEEKVRLAVAKSMLRPFLGKSGEEAKEMGYDQALKAAADKVIEILKSSNESVAEGAVPDNRKIRILNKIMSKPLLAGDIGAQMEAFFAIPDPLMVNEFRKQRAMNGDNIDLRPVVKGFINNSLHPDVQKQVNVNESIVNEYDDLGKEKAVIIKTVSGLNAKDKQQAEVLDRIYKILNSGQISTNIDVAFTKPLVDENLPEAEKVKVRKDMTRIIAGLEQDYGSMKKFLARLETAGGVVNVKELSKPLNTFENVFGDTVATAAFITLANYGVGKKQKGPGEYALACLSNKIKLAEGEGDLQMAGIGKVELKAALSSSGGRIGYGGGSQKAKRAVINKYAKYIPTVMERLSAGTGGSISIRPFIDALNTDLPTNKPNNVKVRKALMTELLTMDLEKFAAPVVNKFATSMNFDEIETEYLKQNFAWYKDRDDFDALLLMHVPNRKTAMIRSAEDLVAFRNSGHANATSISIVPTQAGAGREQWAQLTLNKAKAG